MRRLTLCLLAFVATYGLAGCDNTETHVFDVGPGAVAVIVLIVVASLMMRQWPGSRG